jgi:uncharacterized protein YndB with AHSA1/START domain
VEAPSVDALARVSELWAAGASGGSHARDMVLVVSSTRVTRQIAAARAAVYEALLDPAALAKWRVPDGMSCQVHYFDARQGGKLRVSLTYEADNGAGKTSARTDTYRGRLVKLVQNEQLVEVDEFETSDPALRGEMTISITLADADGGGTELVATHEGLPSGVSPADNETGWRMALEKLALLVEAKERFATLATDR